MRGSDLCTRSGSITRSNWNGIAVGIAISPHPLTEPPRDKRRVGDREIVERDALGTDEF